MKDIITKIEGVLQDLEKAPKSAFVSVAKGALHLALLNAQAHLDGEVAAAKEAAAVAKAAGK